MNRPVEYAHTFVSVEVRHSELNNVPQPWIGDREYMEGVLITKNQSNLEIRPYK
jgi:hypothetical protein